jgi:hypothetical protein
MRAERKSSKSALPKEKFRILTAHVKLEGYSLAIPLQMVAVNQAPKQDKQVVKSDLLHSILREEKRREIDKQRMVKLKQLRAQEEQIQSHCLKHEVDFNPDA